MSETSREFVPLGVAVLTVSDTRTEANDTSGDLIRERLTSAGHRVAFQAIVADDLEGLRGRFREWIDDPGVDVIIATGGTGLTRRCDAGGITGFYYQAYSRFWRVVSDVVLRGYRYFHDPVPGRGGAGRGYAGVSVAGFYRRLSVGHGPDHSATTRQSASAL